MHSSSEIPSEAEVSAIAIVGIGCNLPGGITSPTALWDFLCAGRDGITEVPPDRWNLDLVYDADPGVPGKTVTKWGGFVDDIAKFDASFFGISPREAEVMDPQQRLLLEATWRAFEDAGIQLNKAAGSRTGVYIGISHSDYHGIQKFGRFEIDVHTSTGGALSIAANRLSHRFDLRGPSLSIDTACSSSLVALDLACRALRSGECEMALVGGVNAILTPDVTITFSRASMLSPDGRCKPFDSRANGYVRGEGAAIVVLKPLAQAQADGDRIYATIRATAVNQDGRTTTITVPSLPAQVAMLREVCRRAEIDPDQVGYVEAHGTGTPVGDPIEAEAIGSVFGSHRSGQGPCLLGSIKSNIGHLEPASGIAGLIKAALCVQHGRIPPSLHFQSVNPHIHLREWGIDVARDLIEFPRKPGPRMAAVNSFGFGGTNACAIVQAPPLTPRAMAKRDCSYPLLLPLSAASAGALETNARRIAEHLERGEVTLPDLAGTLAMRRTHLDHRAAVVVETPDDAAPRLRALADGQPDCSVGRRIANPRLAFVFTGQGAQWWGMGRGLLERDPVFRAAVDECDSAFRDLSGWSLIDEMRRGPDTSRMEHTAVAQPATFALQLGLAARWRAWGIEPEAVIGHSIGEIAAAYVGGALSLEDAVCVVYHRSRLQENARFKGSMAAVGLPAQEVKRLFHSERIALEIAAVNAPDFVTVGGDQTEIDRLLSILTAREGVFARVLHVDYAFHTRQMNPFEDELRRSLTAITSRQPAITMFSTVTGRTVAARELDAAYWWRNMREPVLFQQAAEAAMTDGFNIFAELGAHPVLAAPLRGCLAHQGRAGIVIGSLKREQPDDACLTGALAELFVAGIQPAWNTIVPENWNFVTLPPQPFEKTLYWAEAEESRAARFDGPVHPLLGLRLKTAAPRWQQHVGTALTHFLGDHRVDGAVVFPASGYVELMLAAARETQGDMPWEIEGISFHDALVVAPASIIVLETSIDQVRGIVEIASRARGDDLSWTLRASARVRGWRGETSPPKTWRPKIDPPAHIDQARFYRELSRQGHDFGPAFRGVQTLWHEHGQALGQIKLPAEAGPSDGYLLHPALLDACFHVIRGFRGAEHDHERTLMLPVGIDRVRLFRRPGPSVFSRAVAVKEGPAELISDLWIIDDAGQLVAVVEGFRCRRIKRPAALRSERSARIYQERWTPLSNAATPDLNLQGQRWLLLADSGGLASDLARLIEARGGCTILVDHDNEFTANTPYSVRTSSDPEGLRRVLEAEQSVDRIVDLWPLDCANITNDTGGIMSAQALGTEALIALLQATVKVECNPTISIVTAGAVTIDDTASSDQSPFLQAGLIGAARSLRNEHPDLGFRWIDIGRPHASPQALFDELIQTNSEPEVALRAAERFGCRLVSVADDDLPRRRLAWNADAHLPSFQVTMTAPGVIDNLVLREKPLPAVADGDVLIEVHAVGLNFRDVMAATGLLPAEAEDEPAWRHLGFECAGVVRAIGTGVNSVVIDQRVVAVAPGSFASHITVPATLVFPIADSLSFTNAAALPTAYVTAQYALDTLAQIETGETVLVHAATGGVGLAALSIARRRGAEIIATAGSEYKRDYLRKAGICHVFDSRSLGFADEVLAVTSHRGVDAVLNSLPGAFLEKSLSVLAPGGRFLELGKRDIYADTAIGLRSLRQNISLFVIDLARLATERPARLRSEVETMLDHLSHGQLDLLPVERFGLGDLPNAFRHMARAQHIGKIVVDYDAPAQVEADRAVAAVIRADATYMVTGGLSGFGLAVANWLVKQGARSLALVGRSGAARPESLEAVAAMRAAGAAVQVIAADVADRAQLADVLKQIATQGSPLRGIFHAAGVIDDALAAELDIDRIRRVFAPKVLGGWHLHELTRDLPLDLFVCFSSIAGTLGSIGQAHYAAANRTLDALAGYRRTQGLPALSIAWGPIGEVGYLVRRPEVARYLAQTGLRTIPIAEAVDALETLLTQAADQVIFADVQWSTLARANPVAAASPFLSALIESTAHDTKSGGSLRTRLLSLPDEARRPIISSFIREQIGAVLKVSPDAIELARPLAELGLDSLTSFELKNRVEAALGTSLPISKFLQRPTALELAAAISEKLDEPDVGTTELASEDSRSEPAMSIGQEALWFTEQLTPGSPAYGLAMCVAIQPKLDPDLLEEAFARVIARHGSLRLSFPADANGPVPTIFDASLFRLIRHDKIDCDADAFRRDLDREGNRPFDLGSAPLVRLHIFRRGDCDVLLLHVHHIVADAYSLVVCVEEMFEAYFSLRAGAPIRWSRRILPISTYAEWQKSIAEGTSGADHVAFWREQLAGAPAILALPYDFERPALQRGPGASRPIAISRELGAKLKAVAAREGQTLFTVLLGAFNVMLHQLGGDTDIVVGTPTLGRVRADFADAIGYLVNPVPIRTRIDRTQSFASMIGDIGATVRSTLDHQEFPFARLVQQLEIPRDPGHSPIFQVMFAMERPAELDSRGFAATLLNTEGAEIEIREYTISSVALKRDRAQFDLAFVMEEFNDQVIGVVDYRTDIWRAATVDRFVTQFTSILDRIVHSMDVTISDLACERGSGSSLVGPEVTDIPDLMDAIHAAAARRAGHIAVEFGDESWTYRQLMQRVTAVGGQLRAHGVTSESLVGICLPRSANLLVAILAVLEIGATYVPLDGSHPPARLSNLLAEAPPSLIIADRTNIGLITSIGTCPVITLGESPAGGVNRSIRRSQNPLLSELAYIIHTSGSTAGPVGVEIRRDAVSNLLAAMGRELPLSDQDSLLAITTIAFDIAVLELLLPLTLGARVVIADDEMVRDGRRLADRLSRGDITTMQGTPATWQMLIDAGWEGDPAFKALIGGERLQRPLADQLLQRVGGLWNLYGPTETTIWSTCAQIFASPSAISIGRPIANTTCHVVDENLAPVPAGIPGELLIGGRGLARAYRGASEQLRSRFVLYPSGSRGVSHFRTGDFVRVSDGALIYLGRRDQQIKLRGFRIELGEIERVLAAHPAVREAAAILQDADLAKARIMAVVRFRDGMHAEEQSLVRFVQDRLPGYMVPSSITPLAEFPRLPNGKLDRRRLAGTALAPAPGRAIVRPQSRTEEVLVALLKETIGVDDVGIEDDFFSIGGTSLLAMRFLARIREVFQTDVGPSDLMRAPTAATLAQIITSKGPRTADSGTEFKVSKQGLRKTPWRPLPITRAEATFDSVDAAAIAYLPDDFAGLAGRVHSLSVDRTSPHWTGLCQTSLGNIALIVAPLSGIELFADAEATRRVIDRSISYAARLGARSVALTGLIPSATELGCSLTSVDGITLTTGHAATATAIGLTVRSVALAADRPMRDETVCFVGLGAIGTASLRTLLTRGEHPRALLLCDVPAKAAHLDSLAHEIRMTHGFRGEIDVATRAHGLPEKAYQTRFFVCATNAPNVLAIERLRPGTIVVDDSFPLCFDQDAAMRRFRTASDILCVVAGSVSLRDAIHWDLGLPAPLLSLLQDRLVDTMIPSATSITGCILSSLLTEKFDLSPTLGTTTVDDCQAYWDAFVRLGIGAAPLHCGTWTPNLAELRRFAIFGGLESDKIPRSSMAPFSS